MISPLPIFSNMDYYKNSQFQECLRFYNNVINLETDDEELMAIAEELAMSEIYAKSLRWLEQNKRKTAWRKDLT